MSKDIKMKLHENYTCICMLYANVIDIDRKSACLYIWLFDEEIPTVKWGNLFWFLCWSAKWAARVVRFTFIAKYILFEINLMSRVVWCQIDLFLAVAHSNAPNEMALNQQSRNELSINSTWHGINKQICWANGFASAQ